MTNDEVLRLAHQVWKAGESYIGPGIDSLVQFAELVAAATRDEISTRHDLQQALSEINELVRSVEESEKRGQE